MTAPPTIPDEALPPPAAAPRGAHSVVALVLALTLAGARNRWLRRLKRLRNPRYALALLAGAAYLYFVILRNSAAASIGAVIVPWAHTLTALGFTALAATWWLSPSEMGALAFTPPESQLLFPAPLSRRALLVWKVLRAQGTILISTVLWIALLRGGSTTGGWMRALAIWALFSATYLHRLAVQLAHAARREDHHGRVRRGWAAPAAMAAVALMVGASLWDGRAAIGAARTSAGIGAALADALDRGPAVVALAPAWAVAAPLFATSAAEWLPRFALALAVLLLHYAWILARDVPFEESALAASTALAERVAEAQKSRGRGKPVTDKGRWVSRRLGATGPAALAITWKNILGYVRSSRPGRVLVAVVIMGAVNVLISGGELTAAQLAVPMAGAVGVLLVLFGAGVVRIDLRQDLQMLEIVRGWPLRGRAVFGAEVAASATMLLGIQLGYAALVSGAGLAFGELRWDRELALAWTAGAVVGLAALDVAHVALYNLVAVLFPDWVRPDRERMGGIEATGQGMLLFLTLLIALALLLVLPLAAAGVVALVVRQATLGPIDPAEVAMLEFWLGFGRWPVLAGIATAAVVLAVETLGVIWWGGRVLDRMEPPDTK